MGGLTVKQAVQMRHALDAEHPKVSKSQCGGRKAWRVLFKGSTPVFVWRGGGSVGCPGLPIH